MQNTTQDQLHCADGIEALSTLLDNSVDLIVCDPAYWTLAKHRSVGTTTRLGGHRDAEKRTGWFAEITQCQLVELIRQCGRVLKKKSHCWLMCDSQTLPYVLHEAEHGKHGFTYHKTYPVIKRSKSGGLKQGLGYHGRGVTEFAVLLEKGGNAFTEHNWPDFFEANWCGDAETRPYTDDGKKYPTAKPISLFRRWIELSSKPGDTVIDPFCGSGTAVLAALQSGRQGVGYDISQSAINCAQRRINAWQNEHVSTMPFLEEIGALQTLFDDAPDAPPEPCSAAFPVLLNYDADDDSYSDAMGATWRNHEGRFKCRYCKNFEFTGWRANDGSIACDDCVTV